MSRKNTVWGARDKSEEDEILRIIDYYSKTFGITITKLESSAIQAARSMDVYWDENKAKEFLRKLRGVV